MLGSTVSHYRILERLGEGGMGEVFLAEDLRLQRRVALKMMRAGEDADARDRLLREARVASGLSHPNIAVVYEVDEVADDGGPRPFIAMEHVAGRSLAEVARAGPTLAEALRIVREIALALEEAHAKGIVHRDVKPSNVMLTDQGRVKVLDFGLAACLPPPDADGDTWTRAEGAGTLAGTVAYMSPEQARGRTVDGRSDLFSLGAVFYELLAGEPPFRGKSAVEVLEGVLRDDPPPPRGSELPPEVLRVLQRMLAKDPGQRYATARELADDLEALDRGAAPAEAPPTGSTVAVVSFANITGAGEDGWIGTGIAETVSADLRALPGLAVVARERVVEVLRTLGGEGREGDEALALALGRALRARWVVTGAYQRQGELVRVTARLMDVDGGTAARTVKLDGRMADVFGLQDRIVAELVAGLHAVPASAADGDKETEVVEAYEAYSRGLLNLRAESYESLDRALLFFEKAIALDPAYARAHLRLGSVWDVKASYLVAPDLHERAIACFRRALSLRPNLTEAWRELGSTFVSLGREDEGLEAIQRALLLDPGDASAHSAMGRALFIGKARFADAAACYEKALAINPQAGWSALQLAHCASLLRDLARAEDVAQRAAALQEELVSGKDGVMIVGGHMRLGHVAALRGRHEEALRHFEREQRFLGSVDHALGARIAIELQSRVGAALLRLGRVADGRSALESALRAFDRRVQMGADEPFTRYYAAGAAALLGDTERALCWLEGAAERRRAFTVERARIEPEFESLREEPRFRALVG
ncbi:MAG TPA: protein kinase [Vicinamibacteria bacterium]|jgi:tetratricopeptide (TPR) repeat protein/predicted Ser/Thr protein kinase